MLRRFVSVKVQIVAHSVGSSVSQAHNRAFHLKESTGKMQWYNDLFILR